MLLRSSIQSLSKSLQFTTSHLLLLRLQEKSCNVMLSTTRRMNTKHRKPSSQCNYPPDDSRLCNHFVTKEAHGRYGRCLVAIKQRRIEAQESELEWVQCQRCHGDTIRRLLRRAVVGIKSCRNIRIVKIRQARGLAPRARCLRPWA